MNGASKILTVSYGTFSCTLEGFDDPFNTMKAIAEYFRDLAAGDRYFGAEPPTPDAAMLHQIAEREIQRRVEAKIQENGVVLRASEPEMPAAGGVQAQPAVAAPDAPQAAAGQAVALVTATTIQEAPPPAPEAAPAAEAARPSLAPVSESATESVVERLSRLRSEIAAQPAESAAAATSPVLSFAIPEYLEDQHADVLDPATEQALADFLPEAAGDLASELPEDAPVDAPEEEAPEEAGIEFDIAALTEAVQEAAAEAQPEEGQAEDAHPDVAQHEDAPSLSWEDNAPSGLDAPETAEVADDAPAADVDDALSESLRAALSGTEMPDAAEAAAPQEEPAAEAAVDQQEEAIEAVAAQDAAPSEVALSDEALIASLGAAMDMPGAETATAHEDEARPEEIEATAAEAADVSADVSAESDSAWPEADELPEAERLPTAGAEADSPASAGMELRPGAAEKLQRARARVIRIRRSDEAEAKPAEAEAPAAISADAFAEITEEAEAPKAAETTPGKGGALLSAEDEAELQRELAALRLGGAELGDLSETGAPGPQSDARKTFEGTSADESLGRLMQQTDTEMAGSENKRRQSAIAHLKAAVAATVADRKVTGDKTGEADTISRLARYRNDLAMVVKAALPGRSAGGETQAERPAPLVLVSEQRIDRPRPAPASQAPAGGGPAPIRPRRVTTDGLGMATAANLDLSEDDEEGAEDLANLFGDGRGFADFVERVGATSLEQILEASAAYLAGIEGRSHFSRPQLMQHLSTVVPQGSYQREDGLRSFGSLLRNGRFAKVRRGQFTLSDESAYLAEARKIAG